MVSKNHKTVIEINGRRYDALTGKLLKPGAHTTEVSHAPTAKHTEPAAQASHHAAPSKPRPSHSPAKVISHPNAKLQKSQTLMRHAVRKPAHAKKLHHIAPRIQRPSGQVLDVVGNAKPVMTVPVDPHRIKRAEGVKRSKFVSKFLGGGQHYASQFVRQDSELKVVPAPFSDGPLQPSHAQPAVSHEGHDIKLSAKASRQLEEQALMNANTRESSQHHESSHHKTKGRPAKKRMASFAAAGLTVLVLTGFIAYQNVPNFAMRVAASRSGVSAKMPGFRPSGFAYTGPIKYSPGQVTINFKARSDNRSFALTQKTSTWNSDSLLTNYVATVGNGYQTYEDKGRTIYIVENKATWVNGGVWYEIDGDSKLTSDQLVRIATSL